MLLKILYVKNPKKDPCESRLVYAYMTCTSTVWFHVLYLGYEILMYVQCMCGSISMFVSPIQIYHIVIPLCVLYCIVSHSEK